MTTTSCFTRGLALRPVSGSRASAPVRAPVCASLSGSSDSAATSSRRAALLLCASPLLLAARPGFAAFIDLDDYRKSGAKEAMESADQARDDQEDARKRFAFQSTKGLNPGEHQARAKESYARLQKDVKYYLDKKLYPRVSNELSLQMANLRYDLRQIASAQGSDKAARKRAEAETKQAIKALEQLDLYARQNKGSEANEAYADALQKLGTIVKSYG